MNTISINVCSICTCAFKKNPGKRHSISLTVVSLGGWTKGFLKKSFKYLIFKIPNIFGIIFLFSFSFYYNKHIIIIFFSLAALHTFLGS